MVEKFNFYDIYGYLIPGLVLIGLVWIPMGLLWGQWPKQEITSAILLLLFAYILGHLVQGLSHDILPSTMPDSEGQQRHPSNVLLDTTDKSLDAGTKKQIRSLSAKLFDLNLDAQDDDSRRAAIFFQARSALLRQKGDKGAAYWEQFEGLYAMTRNVSLVVGMGTFYILGWAVALIGHFDRFYTPIRVVASLALLLLLILVIVFSLQTSRPARKDTSGSNSSSGIPAQASTDQKKRKSGVISHWPLGASLALIAFVCGSQIALSRTDNQTTVENKPACTVCCISSAPEAKESPAPAVKIERPGFIMLLLCLAVAIATLRIHRAFKGFAREFALAVWRDFANFEIATGEGVSKN